MKKNILITLYILISISLKAETDIVFKDPKDYLHFRISLSSQELFKEQRNGNWLKLGKLNFSNIDLKDSKILTNQTFEYHGNILISIDGTGQLYNLNLKDLSLKRIDNTYFRGSNFWAIKFIRKDTLFSLGGSGFWHYNNVETFFSTKTKEWELLNMPQEDGPKLISKAFGGYDLKRDIISVIEAPPFYHKNIKDFPYRYFEKNLKTNVWKLYGELNSNLLFDLGLKSLNSIFVNGIYMFIDGDFIVIGDPQKNKISLVEKSLPFLTLNYELSENRGFLFSYSKESHFYNSNSKVDSISVERLKKMGVVKGNFYAQSYYNLLFIIPLSFIIICLSLFLRFKINDLKIKNQKISKLEESIFIEAIPNGSIDFLKKCSNYPLGYEFNTQNMNELIGLENYNYESQRQVRSKFIKSINAYFRFYHKIDSLIIRKVSKDDKRMTKYSISEKHYETLKIILKNYINSNE